MLEEIDLLFAKNLSDKEETIQFLAKLFCMSREGNICIKEANVLEVPSCVHRHNDLYYLEKNWIYETRFMEHFLRIKNTQIIKLEAAFDDTLASEQKEAVNKALTLPISIITGGPGTGKTYTASQIIKAFPGKIMLAAPTGKAAARLNGKTLHSLLELPDKKQTVLFADLIIVDECSMIDARLFTHFLSSVKNGTRIVLMGDPNQLPSIEGGSFFADLITACPDICTHLKQNFRSKDGIKQLAYTILEKSPEEALYELMKVISTKHLIDYVNEGYTILSSMRQGPLGADQLNQQIARDLSSDTIPIMITKNNREMNLYNGQTGTLINDLIYFSDGRSFPSHEIPHYDYAYCISVHKSQGSEYDKVLLLLPEGSENFGKELLYTAITRAKTDLQIQSSPELLLEILRKTTHRTSGLASRLNF